MAEVETAVISEANFEPKSVRIELDRLQQVLEQEGYRYYEDPLTKAQYSVDSTGYWFLFDPERGCYEPIVPVLGSSQKAGKENGVSSDDVSSAKPLKSKKQFPCGIQFDDDDHPIYPKNSDGFPILPVDDNGTPFFPRDEYKRPIFPYDKTKKCATFPVDDTDEPIFPRNDQNKPIVPVDDKGNPIFPVDKHGDYTFPLDETNCPIPAHTLDGRSVVPKDGFGNFVIPKDREGKPLIHISSDGVTALSMSEWKQWKKYYKDNRVGYQQQQQQTATPPATAAGYPINSIFHPLSLEQHNAYMAQDIEILQRSRRVRPEDIDLPHMENDNTPGDNLSVNANAHSTSQMAQEANPQQKRSRLIDQLKFAKKTGVLPKKEQTSAVSVVKTSVEIDKHVEKETRSRETKKDKKRKRKQRKNSNSSDSSESALRKKHRKGEAKKKRPKKHQYSSASSSASSDTAVSTRTYSSREGRSEKHAREVDSLQKELPPPPPPITSGTGGGNSDMELSDGAGAVPPAPPQPHKNHNNDHHRHGSGSKKYAKKPADSTIPYDPTKPITQTDIKMAVDAGDISLIRNFIEQTRSK